MQKIKSASAAHEPKSGHRSMAWMVICLKIIKRCAVVVIRSMTIIGALIFVQKLLQVLNKLGRTIQIVVHSAMNIGIS